MTGKMWAYEHYGVKPDIFLIRKEVSGMWYRCWSKVDEVDKNCFVEAKQDKFNLGWKSYGYVRFRAILK
jgi:4-aminobutyrate aminotransferase-like enzyme